MANNQLVAADYFASGSLAPGWTPINSGASQIVVGSPNTAQVQLANGSRYGQIYTATTWPTGGQICEVTLNALAANATVGCGLYCCNGGGHFYVANMNGGGTINVSKDFGAAILSPATTFAAGDVFALGVFGAQLVLYKNGVRIAYGFDPVSPPLSGGTMGFDMISSLAVNSVQVASWRGYSVQQDGVWQKAGIVIPGNQTDLPYGTANPSQPIYEGNSQLGFPGNVLKVWFTGWSANSVYYAESPDLGLTWTRRVPAVLTTVIDPGVIKIGSTYWLYAFTLNGTGVLNAYSSSDGVTFSLQASNIIPGLQYFFLPFTVIGGTTYALASGHLYTSTNQTVWVDQGVVFAAGAGGAMCGGIANVNGTWYVWGQAFPAGGTPDGTETIRSRCTNPGTFTNWVFDAHSMHITGLHEGLNTPYAGQSVPGGIVQVGSNRTLMLTTQAAGDVGTPAIYQIAACFVSASLDKLAANPEDAMPVVATDPFTGGIGGLGPNYTVLGAAPQVIAGNLVEATSLNTTCGGIYVGKSFTPAQWSEIILHTQNAGGNFNEPVLWATNSPLNWYELACTGALGGVNTIKINARPLGALNQLGPSVSATLHVNDKIRLAIFIGSDGFPVLIAYQNGFVLLQVQDYLKQIPMAGGPGFYCYAQTLITDAQISGWSGGNTGVLPYSGGSGDESPGYDFKLRM